MDKSGQIENIIDEKNTISHKKGLVIVFTGNGKGKTTAALGMMLRAWGNDMKVCMVQFIKDEKSNFGEHKAAHKVGIEIISSGDGFVWNSKNLSETSARAKNGWQIAQEKISSGKYDMVVLDEITYCFSYGWLDFTEIQQWLDKNKPDLTHVIITGRNAKKEVIDYADLVTEMREIKHPYKTQGIKAQPGIEY